jgi:hypothetical protein
VKIEDGERDSKREIERERERERERVFFELVEDGSCYNMCSN